MGGVGERVKARKKRKREEMQGKGGLLCRQQHKYRTIANQGRRRVQLSKTLPAESIGLSSTPSSPQLGNYGIVTASNNPQLPNWRNTGRSIECYIIADRHSLIR